MDPAITAEIAAKAEASLDKDDDAGTATGAEKADPAKPDDDSAAADEGVSSDESEDGEEDREDDEVEDTEDSTDSDEDEEENSESEDDAAEDDIAKKPSRAQQRIKQLLKEKRLTQDENAVLRAQLQSKDGTASEKAATDKKLLEKGYTPEQIAEGKKFIESLGYMPPEKVSEMQKKLQRIEDTQLIAEDRAELSAALKKSKSELTEKDVMQYVKKWAKSTDPKIAARASLDYGSIIHLIAGKKVAEKVVDATLKAKKKGAPKIPAGGGGSVTEKKESPNTGWDPGDRMGSMERLLDKAQSAFAGEE